MSRVKLYKRRKDEGDEYTEDELDELIQETDTTEDGSFVMEIDEVGTYDVIVEKPGYLSYTVADINITPGLIVEIQKYELKAGDVVETGEIEIDDLVAMNDNIGINITEENKTEKAIFDLNEDGEINSLDRNILKKNYGKKAEVVEWVDPDATINTTEKEITTTIQTQENIMLQIEKEENKYGFILPTAEKYTITSGYGEREHPVTGEVKRHTGIDLGVRHHSEVIAIADGVVTFAGVQNAFGNCIEIKHVVNGETIYSFYAHLSRLDVKVGQEIKQGEVIGLEGGDPKTDPNPGSSTGHHLHFELRKASGYGNDIDPRDYMEF